MVQKGGGKMRPDCNRCDTRYKCPGTNLDEMETCKRFAPPEEGWTMAEILLYHPTTLNEALRKLPFDTNLNFYLK